MMREYYVGEYAGDINDDDEDKKPEKSESVLHHGLDLSAIAEYPFRQLILTNKKDAPLKMLL